MYFSIGGFMIEEIWRVVECLDAIENFLLLYCVS